jgi:T-complex protein 1 subunit theta
MGLHPSEILIGYEKAGNLVQDELEKLVCYNLKNIRDEEEVLRCMKASIASKQFGLEDFLGGLVTKACLYAIPEGKDSFSTDNIRVQKILGGGIHDSEVVRGMVVTRQSETSIHHVTNAKVAVFNSNIEMNQGETKGTVLLTTAEELEGYSKSEEDRFEKIIQGLAEAGIKVVVGSGSISETALHFFEKYKMMVLKIMSKWELKRIARAVGATPIIKLETPKPEEIGFVNDAHFTEISSQKCTILRRDE